jgi:hypothetical protein
MSPNRARCILLKTAFRRNGPARSLSSGRRRMVSNCRAWVRRAWRGKSSDGDSDDNGVLGCGVVPEVNTSVECLEVWRAVTGARMSDAYALTSFRTSGVQYFSAALGRHAGAKTVGALTFQVTWLKSSLHVLTGRWPDPLSGQGAAILGMLGNPVNFGRYLRNGDGATRCRFLERLRNNSKDIY